MKPWHELRGSAVPGGLKKPTDGLDQRLIEVRRATYGPCSEKPAVSAANRDGGQKALHATYPS